MEGQDKAIDENRKRVGTNCLVCALASSHEFWHRRTAGTANKKGKKPKFSWNDVSQHRNTRLKVR